MPKTTWIILAIVIILAAGFGILPLVAGSQAEQQYHRIISSLESADEQIDLQEAGYDKGYTSSTARSAISSPLFPEGRIQLIHRIDHGPMSLFGSGAVISTTIDWDKSSATVRELAELVPELKAIENMTQISLDGMVHNRTTVPPFSYTAAQEGQNNIEFGGGEMVLDINPDESSVIGSGQIGSLRLTGPAFDSSIDSIKMNFKTRQDLSGIPVSRGDATINKLELRTTLPQGDKTYLIEQILYRGANSVHDSATDVETQFRITGLQFGENLDITVDLALKNLPNHLVQILSKRNQDQELNNLITLEELQKLIDSAFTLHLTPRIESPRGYIGLSGTAGLSGDATAFGSVDALTQNPLALLALLDIAVEGEATADFFDRVATIPELGSYPTDQQMAEFRQSHGEATAGQQLMQRGIIQYEEATKKYKFNLQVKDGEAHLNGSRVL